MPVLNRGQENLCMWWKGVEFHIHVNVRFIRKVFCIIIIYTFNCNCSLGANWHVLCPCTVKLSQTNPNEKQRLFGVSMTPEIKCKEKYTNIITYLSECKLYPDWFLFYLLSTARENNRNAIDWKTDFEKYWCNLADFSLGLRSIHWTTQEQL